MASFDCYLQLEGIPGESLDDKHKEWIELLGFEHLMTQPTSQSKGSAGGATTGRTVHGDFTIKKLLDKSTPKLNEAVSTGKHFKKMKIEVCRSGGTQVKFYEINLEEVLVSKVAVDSHSSPGADGSAGRSDTFPTEEVSFNYGKIEWIYTQQKRADGSGGGNVAAKYDLMAGKV